MDALSLRNIHTFPLWKQSAGFREPLVVSIGWRPPELGAGLEVTLLHSMKIYPVAIAWQIPCWPWGKWDRSFSTGYMVTAHLRPAGRYSPHLQTGMWGLESKRQSRDCCRGNPHSLPPTRGVNRHYTHPPCQASSTPQGRGWVPQHPARARHNEGAQVPPVEQTKEPAGQSPHYGSQG